MKWIIYTGPIVACWVASCATRQPHAHVIGEASLPPDTAAICAPPPVKPVASGIWTCPELLRTPGAYEVHINLSSQRGTLLVDGQTAMDFPVCTGMVSRPTPSGRYHILEKDVNHHSNLYNNASMRYFMRLTWDGVGMHVGDIESHPASHGCIRIPYTACRQLFALLPEGTPVIISP